MAPPNTRQNNSVQKLTLGHILTSRPVWVLILAAVAICAYLFLPGLLSGWKPESANVEQESKAQQVFVNLAMLHELPHVEIPVWYSGEVRAKRKTDVGFARNGKVVQVLFAAGEFVQEQTPIAILDSRQATARLKQLQAEVRVATAVRDELSQGPRTETIRAAQAEVKNLEQQLENGMIDFRRSTRLLAKKGISKQEFDRSELNVKTIRTQIAAAKAQLELLETGTRQEQNDAAEARLSAAEAAVELAQADVDDCTLKAPFSGMIVRRMLDEGTVVSAGTPIFSLFETDQLEFHVGLPVELANTISKGQLIPVRFGEIEFDAMLKSKLETLDTATLTQQIVLTFDESAVDEGIIDGQIGQVRFEQVSETKCFKIPVSAIANDQQGLWSCFTVEGDGEQVARQQSIEVLHFDGDWVFVRGTLTEGQSIVTDGLQRISNGQRVQSAEPTRTARAPSPAGNAESESKVGQPKVEAK